MVCTNNDYSLLLFIYFERCEVLLLEGLVPGLLVYRECHYPLIVLLLLGRTYSTKPCGSEDYHFTTDNQHPWHKVIGMQGQFLGGESA